MSHYLLIYDLADDYLSHIEELMVRGLAAEPRRTRARR